MRKLGLILGILLLVVFGGILFQNCEKKRVLSTNQPSGPTTPPQETCTNNLASSTDWVPRWGSVSAAPNEVPPVSACGSGNVTGRLHNPINETNQFGQVVWTVGVMSQARPYYMRRATDVTFMIPTSAMANWNHVSTFPVFNNPTLGRIGASVYKDKLYIETFDPSCFRGNNLPAEKTLQQGGNDVEVEGAKWYRLLAQVRDMGNGTLEVKTLFYDLSTGNNLASITYPVTCIPSWYRGNQNSWLAGATSVTSAGVFPQLEIFMTDLSGAAY